MTDVDNLIDAAEPIDSLFEELEERLTRQADRKLRNQQIKLKFSDFQQTTMERTTPLVQQSNKPDKGLFLELLELAWQRGHGQGVRLIGLGVNFTDEDKVGESSQLDLFYRLES